MTRDAHALAILGPELYSRLPKLRVLVVGSGGIGCELLKNIVLTGFGHITLLDLDTIDLSNLNRQFLFRKKDVKQPKSFVAARTAAPFNPRVQIEPLHANIKDSQYDVAWFKTFDIVLNALDNLEARRHVNKMCMAANVPLVESGTAGYFGQVQPIVKNQTECFDCLPKPIPKAFPVCTIRSTPSQPIHCIVWAKSYLFPQLFGEDEDDQGELDEALKQGENGELTVVQDAKEIQTLRLEAQAFRAVRAALRATEVDDRHGAARKVFDKVFAQDVQNLLSMTDMWRERAKPIPLNFDSIISGNTHINSENGNMKNGSADNGVGNNNLNGNGIKDQKTLRLGDMLDMFISSTIRLAERLSQGEEIISFDKDDDDALDFVCAAANLRSVVYGIPNKTRWEIKEMAGNIIPAIATTNAIIAGLIVLQALHLLRDRLPSTSKAPASSLPTLLRSVHIQHKPAIPLQPTRPEPPNPRCGVCRDTYIDMRCHPHKVTLREVVRSVMDRVLVNEEDADGDKDEDADADTDESLNVTVYEDKRILADPDFEDNLERTLEDLGCGRGKFITIVDEDGLAGWGTIAVAVGLLLADHPADDPNIIFQEPVPQIMASSAHLIEPPSTPVVGSKRPYPKDEDEKEVEAVVKEPVFKKPKITKSNGIGIFNPTPTPSPAKGYKEVDGIILIEDDADDIIVLDD